MKSNDEINKVMSIHLNLTEIPDYPDFDFSKRRAPKRVLFTPLSKKEKQQALRNVLRYLPEQFHEELIPEFLEELETMGRIYAYRFRPVEIYGHPIDEYVGITEAKAMQVMIDNNLDPKVALYPYELVTYGESGQVFQNWLQYCLIKKYLQAMSLDQTLVVSSGHPVGLFRSSLSAPRAIITNGLMVGQWDEPDTFDRLAALGVTNYGQMTAGGWMYIGSQGIVHGTYITVLNAGRKYLNLSEDQDLKGICFVSSGLGGMSGAQARAVEIAGGIGVVAEVDFSRIQDRLKKKWVRKVSDNLSQIHEWIIDYKERKKPISIAYHGNIVDLLEYIDEWDVSVELISDQTSCHAWDRGGYIPAGLTLEESRQLLNDNNCDKFVGYVQASLRRHFTILQKLTAKGSFFWDYGNAFMDAVFKSGVTVIAKNGKNTNDGFIWPSYVEDIMGPLCFDRGFGPFRWVCLSRLDSDLKITDQIAMNCIDPSLSALHHDNYYWIKNAGDNDLVVGTKARILYADEEGRIDIALKINKAVREGKIGPVMMGRDHHDSSGTDSPFRETSNIYDGSRPTADMSVQSFVGNAVRGMTMVVLSNGGGVGVSRASNGGNGILLDGTNSKDQVIRFGLSWDVMGGVARRCWAGNKPAIDTAVKWNEKNHDYGQITIPFQADQILLDDYIK